MEYTNQDVRRQDRLLDEARAFEILKEGEFGILSMRTEEGDGAYGIPVNYVWDRGNSIYIHCAPVGRKLRCIDACPNVSFCVTGRSKVIPDKFTTGYESIVLQCTAHHSLHEAERMSALSLLISKYCPEHKMQGGLEIGDHYLVNLTGQNGFISPFDYPDGYDGDKPKNMTFSIGVGYRF